MCGRSSSGTAVIAGLGDGCTKTDGVAYRGGTSVTLSNCSAADDTSALAQKAGVGEEACVPAVLRGSVPAGSSTAPVSSGSVLGVSFLITQCAWACFIIEPEQSHLRDFT